MVIPSHATKQRLLNNVCFNVKMLSSMWQYDTKTHSNVFKLSEQ